MDAIRKEALRSLFVDHRELNGYESIVNSMIETGNVTTCFIMKQVNFGPAQRYVSILTDNSSNNIIYIKFDGDSAIRSQEVQEYLKTKQIELLNKKKEIESQFLEVKGKLDAVRSLMINPKDVQNDDLIEDYSMDYQKAYLARHIPHN